MTTYNPDAAKITAQIDAIANGSEGRFLSNFYGKTLDGSDVAEYLESLGYNVVSFGDAGSHGMVILSNGVRVSTNGYAHN